MQSFRIESFSRGCTVDRLVLVSYVKRSGEIHQYSVNAPARNYLCFYEELLDWIVDCLNKQGNEGKWDKLRDVIEASDYPTSAWIALGAGEYTAWGEANFLQQYDEVVVMLYDETKFPSGPSMDVIRGLFDDIEAPFGCIALHQTVV